VKGAWNDLIGASTIIFFGVKLTFMDDPGSSRGTFVAGLWFTVKKEKNAQFWNDADLNLLI
jgi:hypothetical protein